MKKILSLILLLLLSVGFVFAQNEEYDSETISASNEKSVQLAPELSFSIFGPELGILLGAGHLEFGASCAIASGTGSPFFFEDFGSDLYDLNMVAVTPKIHLGYNFEAFDTGWNDTIGLAYGSAFGFFENGTVENMEALAFYFRGAVKTRPGFEVGMTSYLPFVYFVTDFNKNFDLKTIGSFGGFWECIGYGFLCSSLNLRWFF
ncbi:MAG: hypothetical protein IJ688_04005 [Treponema sp.]|nr:hypothetical protein [Treponema sp.]